MRLIIATLFATASMLGAQTAYAQTTLEYSRYGGWSEGTSGATKCAEGLCVNFDVGAGYNASNVEVRVTFYKQAGGAWCGAARVSRSASKNTHFAISIPVNERTEKWNEIMPAGTPNIYVLIRKDDC